MSMEIQIRLPGLTPELATELDRRAELAGAPFEFHQSRRFGVVRKVELGPAVELQDLRDDPSIGSESLDFAEGWPQDPAVREWLLQAMRFLGEHAPERRFAFQAGWIEHFPAEAKVESALAAFLELIAAGRLRSRELYDVRVESARS
jgi:hypothetical protein